ncbi:MAG: HipA domain-containing protein [Gammaproteobacteria bacterium]|nr:HipA domain-containing protein [Gammaproteobacteria bacterium]
MSTDREAVVWSRIGAVPARMGRVYITDRECRFTYDEQYLETGLPGLGVVYAPEYFGNTTISMERNTRFDLLPPLQSLLPPRHEENFQRNLALKYLATRGITGLSGFDADWEILKISGHGGIGHLDLFEDDDRARAWYDSAPATELHGISDELGFSLKEFMTWYEEDIDVLIQMIGPSPTVGGAIPKLLLSIPDSGWDGRIGLPTRQSSPGLTDVVLKFEQTSRYPGIIELEALAMDLHREAGFEVPRYWICRFRDMPALAIERFDRAENGLPLFTETLFSVIASGAPLMDHYSYQYDLLAQAIDTSAVEIVTDRRAGKEHLFRRFIMSLLTGNGDLHLENLSILQRDSLRSFTPVYDPAPMRAYSQHDMLSVMPFGDYGDIPPGSSKPVSLAEAVKRLAGRCGLDRTRCHDVIAQLLAATESFADRVQALASVPDANRQRLIERVHDARQQLGE